MTSPVELWRRFLLVLSGILLGVCTTVVGSVVSPAAAAQLPSTSAPCYANDCFHDRVFARGVETAGSVTSAGRQTGDRARSRRLARTLSIPDAPRVAAEGASQVAPDLANLSSKIEGDLVKRGWTPQEIQDAYANGEQIPAVNKANGAAATRYVNPTTGKSVVIENDTGQVIHVGGSGFKYGPDSGDLP